MRSILMILAVLISFANTAVSEEINPSDVVKIQIDTEGPKPWLNFNGGDPIIVFNIAVHGQALRFTPDMHILPGYIKYFEWDNKRSLYVLKIDSSLPYHNGKKLSANDFEFLLIKGFITTLPDMEIAGLKYVKGVEKLKHGMKFKPGMAEGIRVVDNETIEVSLTGSHQRFLYSLDALLPAIAPVEEFKEDFYTFKNLPVGLGPYKVQWSDPKTSLVRLERVEGTKGPKYVELYSDGLAADNKVDIATGPGIYKIRKFMEKNPGSYRVELSKMPKSIEILEFNFQTDAARLLAFRQAVAFAIDNAHESIKVIGQSPTDQIIPVFAYGHTPTKPLFDLNTAKSLFKSLPAKIRDATHKLVCHGYPGEKPDPYYRRIADSLTEIGMKVDLSLSADMEINDAKKDAAMLVYGRYVDYDPVTTFSAYAPQEDHKNAPASNPELQKLLSDAESTESIVKKKELITKMAKNIADNMIVVPLHERYQIFFMSPRVLSVGQGESRGALNAQNIELAVEKSK